MKTTNIKDLSDLKLLTKDTLSDISKKLFKRRLSGDKDTFVRDIRREFDFYGNEKYNILLTNMILSNDINLSKEVIKTNEIVMIKYLPSFELFLYKYHLGFNKLYEDKSDKIEAYIVDYSHIFDNQFNTSDKRILEWEYNCIMPSIGFDELTNKRNNTLKCGYCGKQYINTNIKYCTGCRSSEYLEEDNYHLLELKPISNQKRIKQELPKEVLNEILALQKETKLKKAKQQLVDNKKRIENKIKEINLESDILTYLINNDDFILLHGIYIFYNHSQTLDFTYKADKMTDTLKELVLKHKDTLEKQFKITVKV